MMDSMPAFVHVLTRHGFKELVDTKPLEGLVKVVNRQPSDHEIVPAVRQHGRAAVLGLWSLLRVLPEKMGAASTVEFLVGYDPAPSVSLTEEAEKLIKEWQKWQAELYSLAMDTSLDGTDRKVADEFLKTINRICNGLDSVLPGRIEFWARKQPAVPLATYR